MAAARSLWIVLTIAAAMGFLCLSACQRADPTMQRIDASHLRTLASLWNQVSAQNRGRPPANEEEFKTLIRGLRPEQLAAMKIEDVDQLFVSERDHKPYVVLYGQQTAVAGSGERLMAYEQEGKEGKRFIALTYGQVREVDQAEFLKLVPSTKER